MTLKSQFLIAAAALTLPAVAVAQTPPPAGSPPAATQTPPSATPPAPTSTTTPPTQQQPDATETEAQQPDNSADDQPAQQTAQTPPAAPTPPATTPQPTPAPGAQAQAPTTPPTPPAAAGAVTPATAADLRAGVEVRDQQGAVVGTIESADAASAVVFTGTARGRLALTSFGRSGQGLVGSSRVDLQACKLEYSIVSPK